MHAALGESARLRIMDILTTGDASPSELCESLGMVSNLLAHHLNVLREVGLVSSRRSEGDGRRHYVRLIDHTHATAVPAAPPERVVFVGTNDAARSQLAAALWRRVSNAPSVSAGTSPVERIDPGAIEVAKRRSLPLRRRRPQSLTDVIQNGDLVITVCDIAHESIDRPGSLHWSVVDPVRIGSNSAFDATFDEIESRVRALAVSSSS